MWMLESKHWSSASAISALNHRDISSAKHILIKMHYRVLTCNFGQFVCYHFFQIWIILSL